MVAGAAEGDALLPAGDSYCAPFSCIQSSSLPFKGLLGLQTQELNTDLDEEYIIPQMMRVTVFLSF